MYPTHARLLSTTKPCRGLGGQPCADKNLATNFHSAARPKHSLHHGDSEDTEARRERRFSVQVKFAGESEICAWERTHPARSASDTEHAGSVRSQGQNARLGHSDTVRPSRNQTKILAFSSRLRGECPPHQLTAKPRRARRFRKIEDRAKAKTSGCAAASKRND